MHMLRRTMGMAMPMKLAMEKKVKNHIMCIIAEKEESIVVSRLRARLDTYPASP